MYLSCITFSNKAKMLYAQYQILLCDNYTKENLYIKIVTLFRKSRTRKEPDFLINKNKLQKKDMTTQQF